MIVGFVCMLEGTNLAQNRKSKGTYVDAPVLRPTTRAVIPARYFDRYTPSRITIAIWESIRRVVRKIAMDKYGGIT